MKSTHALRALTLAGLGTLIAAPSFAQDSPYYYGGLSIGRAHSKYDPGRLGGSIISPAGTLTITGSDDKDTAYKVFGGYQFNRNMAVEAGYFNLGKSSWTATTTPAGTLSGQIRTQGLNVDAVGTLPLTESLAAFVRAGAQHAKTSGSFDSSGGVTVTDGSPHQRGINYKVGAGLQYAFSSALILRGEAERYRVKDPVGNHANINVISVGLVFPFGGSSWNRHAMAAPAQRIHAPEAPPEATAAPMPVEVQATMPDPVVAAAPVEPVATPQPIPMRQRVSVLPESMFEFDTSTVQQGDKAALDQFSSEVTGTRFDMINVQGHADRLGPAAYNQRLSEQRAASVKSYLVSSGKLDPAKITATGQSESAPVTKPGDCVGSTRSVALVTCLQPDRRVDIHVSGVQ